jgi:cell division FtsZ-interacting protein ZapD
MHKIAKLTLCLRYRPLIDGLDFNCQSRELSARNHVARVFHTLQLEETFLKTELQTSLLEALYNKTHMFHVLFERTVVDVDVVEVNCNKLVLQKSR